MDPFTGKRNYRFTWTGSNVKRLSFTRNYDAPMYRRDMYFALDAEMVGVGPRGMKSALARVALVNWENEIVFHAYVKAEEPVTDYRSFVSGIKPEQIQSKSAVPLAQVRNIISTILVGKILIGHGLENDLETIGIDHPWCDTRDTATYVPLMCKQQISSQYHDEKEVLRPRKLKDLVYEKLGREIQVIGKPHCPVEDAKASMDLYKLYRHDWEKDIRNKFNSSHPGSLLFASKINNSMDHNDMNSGGTYSHHSNCITPTSPYSNPLSAQPQHHHLGPYSDYPTMTRPRRRSIQSQRHPQSPRPPECPRLKKSSISGQSPRSTLSPLQPLALFPLSNSHNTLTSGRNQLLPSYSSDSNHSTYSPYSTPVEKLIYITQPVHAQGRSSPRTHHAFQYYESPSQFFPNFEQEEVLPSG